MPTRRMRNLLVRLLLSILSPFLLTSSSSIFADLQHLLELFTFPDTVHFENKGKMSGEEVFYVACMILSQEKIKSACAGLFLDPKTVSIVEPFLSLLTTCITITSI